MTSPLVKTNLAQKAKQEAPRLSKAAYNMKRYGVSRLDITKIVRQAMDNADADAK